MIKYFNLTALTEYLMMIYTTIANAAITRGLLMPPTEMSTMRDLQTLSVREYCPRVVTTPLASEVYHKDTKASCETGNENVGQHKANNVRKYFSCYHQRQDSNSEDQCNQV